MRKMSYPFKNVTCLQIKKHIKNKEMSIQNTLFPTFFLYPYWHHPLVFLLQVNDDLLVKIASRRQNVTEINISDCRGVHDHGVSSLASHCPSLQKYTAYRCKQLGDASLSALAAHCPLLVKVHVGNQDKLTDESLKKVRTLYAGLFLSSDGDAQY